MKKLLLILLAFTLIISCSKDDGPGTEPTVITGGEAFKGQVVTIEMPEGSLESEEYLATFNGLEVVAVKGDSTKLLFSIPTSTPVGVQSLVVPSLSLTVNYDVKSVVLPATPEEVVEGFVADFGTFLQMINESPEASDAQNALDNFNAFYENASAEEKLQIAETYYVNKALFDEILLNDYSNVAGRNITVDDLMTIQKHLLGVIAMNGGAYILIYGVGGEKILGAAIAIAGAIKAKDYFFMLANKALNTDGVELDGQAGTSSRNGLPVFYHGAAKTLSFKTKERKLTAADEGKTQPAAVKLYSMYNKYNWCANKMNIAITWINNHVPFVSFKLVPLEQFATTAPSTSKGINADTFANLTFSVNHPNVTLVNATFVGEGQIAFKFTIEGTPTTLPVETMLNYSYTDELNTFTGHFMIQVTNELLCEQLTDIDGNLYNVIQIGSNCWTTKNLTVSHYRNGDVIPQIQDQQQWAAATTGAWCYYENETSNGTVYGKLYNWYAVTDVRGLAPEGYHIPSEAEFDSLIQAAGTNNTAGPNLSGTTGWTDPLQQPTNSTGFSALPAGFRIAQFYANINSTALFWSTTPASATAHATSLNITFANSAFTQPREYFTGMSVRCVKD